MVEWLPIAQFVASTALTGMSVTVAIVAAVFGYRNLNGWKPVLLSSGAWMGELKEPGMYVATIFEVWNRRKYAIMVRGITVDFGKLKSTKFVHVTTGEPLDEEWSLFDGKASRSGDFFIEANAHRAYHVAFKFEPVGRFEDWPGTKATIKVLYYDVKKNRDIVLEKVVGDKRDISFLR